MRGHSISRLWMLAGGLTALVLVESGCGTVPSIGQIEPRRGDEIVAAGQFFHTGTPVALWMDPGGYDGYRVERRFGPVENSSWQASHTNNPELTTPNRYGERMEGLSSNELDRVRGGGWDLPLLQRVVDQFVIHYDDVGTSRKCFEVLHDDRGLSVHFLLDLDGTIYQTLDLKERAWHATTSNSRSVGVEIANLGAFPPDGKSPLDQWYKKDGDGRTVIALPPELGDGGIRTKNFTGHPARPGPVRGNIQGADLLQYDFTSQQYAALIKLTAAICNIFPKVQCRYPVDDQGRLIPHKLPDDQLRSYQGVLGHYHIQTNKLDPGPAFQWDRVIDGAQKLLKASQAPKRRPLLSPRAAGNWHP
jgi:N-acetylmuramoyl-L-alanine amidase